MEIEFSSKFVKHYRLRIRGNKSSEKRYSERVRMFLNNPNDPILRYHKLKGKFIGLGSFSVAGDLRIIVEELDDHYLFHDIGSHNQVYK